MKRLHLVCTLAAVLFAFGSPDTSLLAQAPATTKTAKAPAVATPSAAEIADAKSKGMVWVNLSSKVYHKDGKYFGNTKSGKFMTEADAQKAGYRASKDSPIKAKSANKK